MGPKTAAISSEIIKSGVDSHIDNRGWTTWIPTGFGWSKFSEILFTCDEKGVYYLEAFSNQLLKNWHEQSVFCNWIMFNTRVYFGLGFSLLDSFCLWKHAIIKKQNHFVFNNIWFKFVLRVCYLICFIIMDAHCLENAFYLDCQHGTVYRQSTGVINKHWYRSIIVGNANVDYLWWQSCRASVGNCNVKQAYNYYDCQLVSRLPVVNVSCTENDFYGTLCFYIAVDALTSWLPVGDRFVLPTIIN